MIGEIAEPGVDQENYFISLNDLLVGMLFVFIVLLMTYSLIFEDSVDRLEEKLTQRTEIRTALLHRLEAKLEQQGFESEVIEDEGVLRLSEEVLFEPGQATLDTRARDALRIIATELANELPCYGASPDIAKCAYGHAPIFEAVYIEGHTDNIPINNNRFHSNWDLSSARAIKTYDYITDVAKLLRKLPNASGNATLLGASAYADSRGVTANRTVAERKKNRRIDFRFLLAPPTDREVQKAATAVAQQ